MSWYALENQYKNLNIKEIFWLNEFKNLYLIDIYNYTHSIFPQENLINSKKKINPTNLFDEITYSKGCGMIKYLFGLIGEENFKYSIQKYVGDNKFSNTNSEIFFNYFNDLKTNINGPKIIFSQLINDLVKIKGYPIIFINWENSVQNVSIKIKAKIFNLDELFDFNTTIYLKCKYKNKNNHQWIYKIIEINSNINTTIEFDNMVQTDTIIFNPDAELFGLIYYSNKQINNYVNLKNFNQIEIMKYINDELIFMKFTNYLNNSNNYFPTIKWIFELIDLNLLDTSNIIDKFGILLLSILNDFVNLIYLFRIMNLDEKIAQLKKFIDLCMIDKLLGLLKLISSGKLKKFKHNYVLYEKILLFGFYIENSKILKIIQKIYKNKFIDNFYPIEFIQFYRTKYKQNLNKIKFTLKYGSDENCKNLIKSFEFLNEINFHKIMDKYKKYIKKQFYKNFFIGISKNEYGQKYIIENWDKFIEIIGINTNENIFENNKSKILISIIKNIFDVNFLRKTSEYFTNNKSNNLVNLLSSIELDKINLTIKKNLLMKENFKQIEIIL